MIVAVLLTVGDAVTHPKPGAHPDVRVTVTPSGVRVDLLMNLMFVGGLVRGGGLRKTLTLS